MENKKYIVKQSDLKGQIKEFPLEVVQAMIDEQVYQGNAPDVRVFQKKYNEDKFRGGFDWDYKGNTQELNFWSSVLKKRDFSKFFKRYPKSTCSSCAFFLPVENGVCIRIRGESKKGLTNYMKVSSKRVVCEFYKNIKLVLVDSIKDNRVEV